MSRGRLRGLKDKIARFRRTKQEIIQGLTKAMAKKQREENIRIAKLQEDLDKSYGRKKKRSASTKTKDEIVSTRKQKLRRLMTGQRKFADTKEVIARIRKIAAEEVAADPLFNRDLRRKNQTRETEEPETQSNSGFNPTPLA